MKVKDLILTALFAALTAIGAFLGFKFVLASITLQFLFTAMAGVLLGRRYGALSQAVYVLLGLVGVPIFAQGGGFSYVLQPTFGFLLGLIPAAWVIGVLAKRPLKFWRTALAMLAGLAVLYAIGVPYMALIANGYLGKSLTFWQVMRSGMLIYLPGDMLKIAVEARCASRSNAGSRRRAEPLFVDCHTFFRKSTVHLPESREMYGFFLEMTAAICLICPILGGGSRQFAQFLLDRLSGKRYNIT